MAVFNAEFAAKALERRVTGLERTVEAIEKTARAAGDTTKQVLDLEKQVAAQAKRIDDLEKLVKTLVESRGDSKTVALEKLAATTNSLVEKGQKELFDVKQQSERDRADLQRLMLSVRASNEGIAGAMSKFDAKARRENEEREKKFREELRQAQDSASAAMERLSERIKADQKRLEEETKRKFEEGEARVMKEVTERVSKDLAAVEKNVLEARLRELRNEIEAVRAQALSKR